MIDVKVKTIYRWVLKYRCNIELNDSSQPFYYNLVGLSSSIQVLRMRFTYNSSSRV